ncbi:hypothetical protein [Serratia marcescens]|uniref:hypothetical protein n=1 Tax=Serratia marcescens TaxID=615 RepID=UPI002178F7D8|nr:hypothetical protein [Serratia marcescens]CAI1715261.1 Uncharacterised protein [Serratia marcescens]
MTRLPILAAGYQHVMNLTAFGQAATLKEYEHTLLKRRAKLGIQTSLRLNDGCDLD